MFYHVEQQVEAIVAFTADHLTRDPHIHPDMELVFLKKGKSLASADQSTVAVEAGDLFLCFPNQIHFYNDQEPVEPLIFIFSPDLFEDLRNLFHKNIPRIPLIKKAQLPGDIGEKLDTIHRCSLSANTYERIAAKGHLMVLLAEIIPAVELVDCPTGHDCIKALMTYCLNNYTQPLTLDMLAQELHLSKFYISHILKERMGICFTDFVNTLRAEHACELLKSGSSITDAAFASGFSSIRNFNRVFAKLLHTTPRAYIRSHCGADSEEALSAQAIADH